MAPGGTRQS